MEKYIEKCIDKFIDWLMYNHLEYLFMFVLGVFTTSLIFSVVYFWYN